MEVKCPSCKNRFAVPDSSVGQRGQCVHCQSPVIFKPARPLWVLVMVPLGLVVIAAVAVLVFRSSNNVITITEKSETGEMVKTVLHVDHGEYEEKTRKLFAVFEHMNLDPEAAIAVKRSMTYKAFTDKFGDLAGLSTEYGDAEKLLSDDEKKLTSWVYVASAFNYFQASSVGKLHEEASGNTKETNGNSVAWNLKVAACCWRVASGAMKAGDELVVPLDCPMCEGEKQVACGCCGGVKTVIDASLGASVPCTACNETGKVTCPVCKGEGRIIH